MHMRAIDNQYVRSTRHLPLSAFGAIWVEWLTKCFESGWIEDTQGCNAILNKFVRIDVVVVGLQERGIRSIIFSKQRCQCHVQVHKFFVVAAELQFAVAGAAALGRI